MESGLDEFTQFYSAIFLKKLLKKQVSKM